MKYCDEFAALLDAYIDGMLSPEALPALQTHLEQCGGCQAYVDDAFTIRAMFPTVEDTLVPDGFADGISAMIRVDAAPRKSARPRWQRMLVPLAACLAIVVLVQGRRRTGECKR